MNQSVCLSEIRHCQNAIVDRRLQSIDEKIDVALNTLILLQITGSLLSTKWTDAGSMFPAAVS